MMLRAADLSFSYDRARARRRAIRAGLAANAAGATVSQVSLDVRRGDLVGILGPNGSGKTTLLKLLCGVLKPASGALSLDDRPLAAWSARELAKRVAFVPQDSYSPFDYSVLDVVMMGRFPHLGSFTLEGPEDLAIARRALDATGIAALETRSFTTLSGGERQRAMIASALAQSPELLLLDEPTAALDIGHQIEIQHLLHHLNIDCGVTIVLSTHDLNFAVALCHRLVLMRDGRVLRAGPTTDVITSETIRALYGVEADVTRHPPTGLLTVIPRRDGLRESGRPASGTRQS